MRLFAIPHRTSFAASLQQQQNLTAIYLSILPSIIMSPTKPRKNPQTDTRKSVHSIEEINAKQAKKKAARKAYYQANRDKLKRAARERHAAKATEINEKMRSDHAADP